MLFAYEFGALVDKHKTFFIPKTAPYIESWSTPSLNKKFKKKQGKVKLFIFSHLFKNTKQEGNDGDDDDEDDEADEGAG